MKFEEGVGTSEGRVILKECLKEKERNTGGREKGLQGKRRIFKTKGQGLVKLRAGGGYRYSFETSNEGQTDARTRATQ